MQFTLNCEKSALDEERDRVSKMFEKQVKAVREEMREHGMPETFEVTGDLERPFVVGRHESREIQNTISRNIEMTTALIGCYWYDTRVSGLASKLYRPETPPHLKDEKDAILGNPIYKELIDEVLGAQFTKIRLFRLLASPEHCTKPYSKILDALAEDIEHVKGNIEKRMFGSIHKRVTSPVPFKI
jgi:hypothetical protein